MLGNPKSKLSFVHSPFFSLSIAALILSLPLNSFSTQKASGESQKSIMSVRISSDPVRRQEDLRELSQFDILGVSLQQGLAEIAIPPHSLAKLRELGFEIEFSPLNDQLTQEGVEAYLTPTDVLNSLASLSTNYPALTELKTIGFTRRKRPIQALVISSHPTNQNQPTILFNAMHHAREVMTTEVIMHMAEVLLKGYGLDPEITRWLDSARLILIPQVNPDGNQLVHDGQAMWRKNAWESDGRTFGVDINRNYPTLWGACNGSSTSKSSDSFRGPEASSEPETKAMMNLVLAERPVANISYHAFSEMILYPYGCRKEKNPSLELFKSIASEMKAKVIDDSGRSGTYALGTPPEILYEADGTDMDWQYREAGVISFAMEINSRVQGFQPAHKRWRDLTVKRQEGAWKALIRKTIEEGVQGRIATNQLSDVSYRVSKIINGIREDFTGGDASVKPFKARSAEGFLFNALLPGHYELTLKRGDSIAKVIDFVVEEGKVTQLGDINL